MKFLIAIVSCAPNRKRRDWQRQTWLSEFKGDYNFFVGRGAGSDETDIIQLPCEDDYNHLPEKTLEIVKWARAQEYDYLFKIDDDVYVRSERLSIPEGDYIGHAYGHKEYCSGAAYWLSTKSMNILTSPNGWVRRSNAEDYCIGYSLKRAGITLIDDKRYRIGWKCFTMDKGENEFPHPENDAISFHCYWPQFMPELHSNWNKRNQLIDATHFNDLKNR